MVRYLVRGCASAAPLILYAMCLIEIGACDGCSSSIWFVVSRARQIKWVALGPAQK